MRFIAELARHMGGNPFDDANKTDKAFLPFDSAPVDKKRKNLPCKEEFFEWGDAVRFHSKNSAYTPYITDEFHITVTGFHPGSLLNLKVYNPKTGEAHTLEKVHKGAVCAAFEYSP